MLLYIYKSILLYIHINYIPIFLNLFCKICCFYFFEVLIYSIIFFFQRIYLFYPLAYYYCSDTLILIK